MLQHYKKRGWIGAAVFLSAPAVMAIFAVLGVVPEKMPHFVLPAFGAVTMIAFIYSIASFVFAKGYTALSGLGLVLVGPAVIASMLPSKLSSIPMVVGLLILVFLPDKHREPEQEPDAGG